MERLENRVIKSLTTKVSNVSVNRDIQLLTNKALNYEKPKKKKKPELEEIIKKLTHGSKKPFRRKLVMLCLGN